MAVPLAAATNEFAITIPEGDRARLLAVSRAYILAFFKQHLLGEPQPLLDGPSAEYPEATFETKP